MTTRKVFTGTNEGDVAVTDTTTNRRYLPHKDLPRYDQAFQVCQDYMAPIFLNADRWRRLYEGEKPDELMGTFSQIMINTGFAMVQEALPILLENMLGQDNAFSVTARSPERELSSDSAAAWLKWKMLDESQVNLRMDLIPTLQSACVMGAGYRIPYLSNMRHGDQLITSISSRDVDFFQLLPMPGGGLVNPMGRDRDECIPGFFVIDWMNDDQIKDLRDKKGGDKDEIARCLAVDPAQTGKYDRAFDRYQIIGGIDYGGTKEDWRVRLRNIPGTRDFARRRIVYWFLRDRTEIWAHDFFKIYDGPAFLDDGLLPLCVYKTVPDFNNFAGVSKIDKVEDLLTAFLLNFNWRMDLLAEIMFPRTWMRDDVMAGRPESEFYWRPNALYRFPLTVQDIGKAIYRDRAQDVSPDSWMTEDRLLARLQDVTGKPNYSRGIPSQGTIENRTASGIINLMRAAEGRQTAESMSCEHFGLRQELRLQLAMAKKYQTRDVKIRLPTKDGGFAWSEIDADDLDDDYTVECHGTRYAMQRDQTFQKVMALYPIWNGLPNIDKYEMARLAGDMAGITAHDMERLNIKPQMPMQDLFGGMAPEGMGGPGGAAAMQNMGNRTGAMQNRNRVRPATRPFNFGA